MRDPKAAFKYKNNPLKNFLSNNKKKLVLFGASWQGRRFFEQLLQSGITVDFFCDNSEEKWGTFFCERKVISPAELLQKNGDMKILIVSGSFPAIFVQLDSLGIEDVFDWCLLAKRIN